jgi:hypothetical protein
LISEIVEYCPEEDDVSAFLAQYSVLAFSSYGGDVSKAFLISSLFQKFDGLSIGVERVNPAF